MHAYKIRGCTAIQTWGFTDKYSWIRSHSHGTRGAALLLDRTYKPKPAYERFLGELLSTVNRAQDQASIFARC